MDILRKPPPVSNSSPLPLPVLGFWARGDLLGLSVGIAPHCHLLLHHWLENVAGWAGRTTTVLILQKGPETRHLWYLVFLTVSLLEDVRICVNVYTRRAPF